VAGGLLGVVEAALAEARVVAEQALALALGARRLAPGVSLDAGFQLSVPRRGS
jgi:hypothetical protein